MNRALTQYRSPDVLPLRLSTIALLASMTLLCACGSESPTAPNNENPIAQTAAEPLANALFKAPGCDAGAAGASFVTSGGAGYNLLSSFGNPQGDAAFAAEVITQRQFWGPYAPAKVYILNEGSPRSANALSLPGGAILFGYYFYNNHIALHGTLAIDGTLAHEWGHQVQFDYNVPKVNPGFELEADAFSGYYMAMRKGYAWANIQSYYAHFASIGDYNFNMPDHHGTPAERLAAVYLGVNTAIYAMQTRQAYTYVFMHSWFSQEIGKMLQADVAGRGSLQPSTSLQVGPSGKPMPSLNLRAIVEGKTMGAEVEYPRISLQERERLYPANANTSK